MSTVYPRKTRRKSTSIQATDGSLLSSSALRQQLTKNGQQSLSSHQRADGSQVSTQITPKPLKPTLSANGNDPQLLAEIFKPTVEAMQALGLLTLAKTTSGKLVIILSTNMFNDDLTVKTS